ncbi:MAG: phosphoribosylanthranilate isomerase [Firmicutes bacterium]|nr:phosphoribosylanthranilate isomerase [Bacillota bacterium]
MIPVKICGITNLNDALTCIRNGVSALGFIFAESKRRVAPEVAREISRQLPPFVTKVGVFVDEEPATVNEILRDCRLDLAQLHGLKAASVVEMLPGRVIKVFRAGMDPPDPSWTEAPLRAVLVDTYHPDTQGGTGVPFNWDLFGSYRKLGFPVILAGGLKPENILSAIQTARPDAVDLSSGVELKPGVKDPVRIRQLMSLIQKVE